MGEMIPEGEDPEAAAEAHPGHDRLDDQAGADQSGHHRHQPSPPHRRRQRHRAARGQAVHPAISDYMGWVIDRLANDKPVKGIVISDGYDNKFKSTLRTTTDIKHIELHNILSELGLTLK